MFTPTLRSAVALTAVALAATTLFKVAAARAATPVSAPVALIDELKPATHATETAVFAGGCFWGVQAVFQHVRGVSNVISGYTGGGIAAPSYNVVSTGMTGHAESVRVTYDPSQVTYGTLLRVFFAVAHDPTTLDRQGPDRGTQYRSAIFTTSDEQSRIANAYVAQLATAHVFDAAVVTQITPLATFYPAEDYHQNYATDHPYSPYIMINDAPKVAQLKKSLPALWQK